MAASKNDERRKHSRVGFATQIKIILKTQAHQMDLEGSSKDLSLKGIFVRTDKQFVMGTACCVNVYLTGGIEEIKLSMEGSVVRQTDTGIGIAFDSMDVDAYSHLKNIVRYNRVDDSA